MEHDEKRMEFDDDSRSNRHSIWCDSDNLQPYFSVWTRDSSHNSHLPMDE